VIAHSRKSFGGGLPELRRVLAAEGVTDPLWYAVKKSRSVPKYARLAAAKGADVMFVWGGDGTVQRCVDAVADTDTAVAILPAGTANLLAANLGVPHDLAEAVRVGLHGDRRRLDTGSVNGERFTVMAGAGLDARMRARIEVDGMRFFEGKVSCVLTANVGKILGGVEAFPQARPDDGRLELGVVTARDPVQWARTFGQIALLRCVQARSRSASRPHEHASQGRTAPSKVDWYQPVSIGIFSTVRPVRGASMMYPLPT
jgi:diacylglycerol kinase family enzyme